jgi:drug/metabolite transporter (DMT)-like permease
MKNKEHIGILLILISSIGYAFMPILSVKPLIEGTAVSTLLFMRFGITSLLIWPYIFIKKIKFKLPFKTTLYLILLCIMGFTVATVSIYNAYIYISGSIATLLMFTHPILVMIFEKFIFKTIITKKKLLAIIITTLGLVVVLYVKEPLSIKGIIFGFLASVAYAVYCIGLTEKNVQTINGVAVTAYMATTTTIAMAVYCFITDTPLIATSQSVVLSAVLLSLFCTILASITFYESLSRIGASSTTLISSVEPMMVVVLCALLLNEVFTFNTIIGGVIIIIGIIVLEYKK